MLGLLKEKRDYDTRRGNMLVRSMMGWVVLTLTSFSLFFANVYLLIAFPTVGLFHSIFGAVLGFILVVGSTANLMGYFYDDAR